jgi:hypothetical protein
VSDTSRSITRQRQQCGYGSHSSLLQQPDTGGLRDTGPQLLESRY